MTENATVIDRNDFTVSGRDLRTAGLRPEGSYLFEIVNATPRVYSGVSQFDGQQYTTRKINFFLRAHQVAVYAPDGTGKGIFTGTENLDPKPTFFKEVNISPYRDGKPNKGLATIDGMYKAVTGQRAQGEETNILALAEEMRGGKVWGTIFWSEDEETGQYKEVIKNSFRSQDQGPVGSIVLRDEE